jgi:anti-sigma-K factor RskA
MLRTCRRVWARHMATLRRPKSRKGSRDGFRQAAVVTAIGVVLAAGLFAAGDYVVQQQRGPATVKAFIKTAPGSAEVASASGGDENLYRLYPLSSL